MTRDCPKCHGTGCYETTLRDLSGKQPHSCGVPAIVPCDFPTCHNGKVTDEATAAQYAKLQAWGTPRATCPACERSGP